MRGRITLLLLALLMAVSLFTASCADKSDPEASMKEMQSEADKLKGNITGKWQLTVPLAEALTQAHNTVWDKNIEGYYTIVFEVYDNGKMKISADIEDVASSLKKYFLSEEYTEDAADAAAKIYSEPLRLDEDITYKFAVNTMELSSGIDLQVSDDKTYLTMKDHDDFGDDKRMFYVGLLRNAKIERIEEE